MHLAVLDNQCMELVEQLSIAWQILHEQGPDLLVIILLRDKSQMGKNTPGIGINDKGWFVAGIKKNRITSLRSYSTNFQ